MRRVLAAAAVSWVLTGGCTIGTSGSTPATDVLPSSGLTPSGSSPSAGSLADRATLPPPDGPLPGSAPALARDLERTGIARLQAVRAWVRSGGTAAWPPPEDVELLVLHEQRIYRLLAADDRLAGRVLARLPRELAAEARANVRAGGALFEHVAPVRHLPQFRTRAPQPADVLHGYFEDAQARFGVDWEVLAAIMLIETRMGRVVSSSSAGARGPMQFLPATWETYGLGGDVRDEHDAVMGAANYLSASGAPSDYRAALYRYNPVGAYVRAVMTYANVMMRDPQAYYAYYNWQVFVRTTHRDVRVTGPDA